MLSAVNFKHQFCLGTIKINDVVTDCPLSVKLITSHLSHPDFRPKPLLSISHALSQFSCKECQFFVVFKHSSKFIYSIYLYNKWRGSKSTFVKGEKGRIFIVPL